MLWVAGCATTTASSARANEVPSALAHVTADIQSALDRMDNDVQDAANLISLHGLSDEDTRRILRALYEKHSYAIDTCTVDLNGRIVAVEPQEYRHLEGINIHHQEQVKRLLRTRRAVLSGSFLARENVRAVDLEWPVFDRVGTMVGSVSILIRSEALLSALVTPHLTGVSVDFSVMQPDGLILYDPDAQEIGRTVFTDPLYEPYRGLRSVLRRMARSKAGSGTYPFTSTGLAKETMKQTYWDSVGLHGAEWRVSLVQVVSGDPASAKREFSDLEIIRARDALRRLTRSSTLQRYMVEGDTRGVEELLKGFYDANPGLRAVQWVDGRGVSRIGYPPKNSQRDFDLHRGVNENDSVFLGIVERGKESWTTAPAGQGRRGLVYMAPVNSGATYLGMLYFIRVLP
jgi:hypothetical protein